MNITKDQIRKLQTLKHQVAWLCKDRATWESFLTSCAGRAIASSTELSLNEGIKAIDELQRFARGSAEETAAHRPLQQRRDAAATLGNDFDSKARQLKKIEHLLDGRPWSYADSLAKRICKVDSVRFVRGGDLRKIIAALEYDRQRRHRASGE